MTRVSAIVSCLNNDRTIKKCLRLLTQNEPDEVVVVDGGSSDETRRIVSEFANVAVIDNVKGLANARNIGWQRSKGDLILFLDGDAYMTPHALVSLLELLKTTEIAGVACRIVGANVDKLVPRLRDIDFKIQYSKSFRGSNITDCVSDPAICGLYYRKVLEEVNGFKSDFPFVEDMEFLERMRSKGYRVLTCYDPPILHNHRETVSDLFWQLYRHGFGRGIMDATSPLASIYARREPLKLVQSAIITLSAVGPVSLLYPFYRMIAEIAYMLGYLKGRRWRESQDV